MPFLRVNDLSFAYPGMAEPLLAGVTVSVGPGWTGVVGANGAGKTTFLRLAVGELEPTQGAVNPPDSPLYVAQRTDLPPEELADFFEAADAESYNWRIALGVGDDWADRWDSLSHGERKRLQIAIALWRNPGLLALDEPTNHLDADARETLLQALRRYRGIGLLVSHDRALLDALCQQCLFLLPPRAVVRPGGVTQGMEQDRIEQQRARSRDDAAKHSAERLRAAAQERREAGEQAAARNKLAEQRLKRSMGGDHDGKARRNLAKLTNKDAWAGKQSAALARRAGKAAASRAGLGVRKEFATGFWIEEAEASTRNRLLRLPAGELPLGGGRVLRFPDLEIAPTDRIALTGPNGCGKSSFLRHVEPLYNVEPAHLTLVPQEITAARSREILAEAKRLRDDELGKVMTNFSLLGSRPGRLLDSVEPSPGEVRKLLLSLGIARVPHLIVMDEPTNHLDLPAILCLEDALVDCPCALLLVSHDERFLSRLTRIRWDISPEGDDGYALRVRL